MRATSVAGTLACLLLVAGCATPAHQDGNAAPAGSPDPTTSAATTGTPASSTPPTPSASSTPSTPSVRPSSSATTSAPLVLGPDGIGSLKLGMTRQQATATEMLRPFATTGRCGTATLRAAPFEEGAVTLSPTLGIAAISAWSGIKTPEGLRIGMSSAEMLRIYPAYRPAENADAANARGYATTPGNNKASYRIATRNGKVTALALQLKNQDCYE
ncbi:hypothetical protein AB0B86_24150 [Micromonospora sp. NPDC049047]|uniref:hypothetical protein n=1 Tax=Micromonospora sp. NPDC049047 TaxID=3155645 RepID=UPI00340697A5